MQELNDDDAFIDILENRRKTKDLYWANKPWEYPICRYSKERSPMEIKQSVLNSSRVRNVIKQLSREKGCDEEEIEADARAILDEMAHTFQTGIIRFFGYTLSKFMKKVYGKILVNKKGAEKLKSVASQYPIIYLPTHRSYADFLLVSYLCFFFNLPVPVIAAGLGLKALSFLLRGAGAFFIRRSFVGDKLYKEIFTEYVQTHIEGTEFSMEFFIEGTRSRTAKSLVPKLGMLQVILELFFSAKVPDVIIVPISISYDRTLEETLYAYELLGVPKPKESTKGLFKARKIMSDYYGNIYVKFGEQISLKDYFRSYDRSVHNLHPRSLSICTNEEKYLCRKLANHVIRMHQYNLLLSPFPLVCLIFSQPSHGNNGVHFSYLLDTIYWLEKLIRRTGTTPYKGGASLAEALSEQLMIHSNIIEMKDAYVSLKQGKIKHPETSSNLTRLKNNTIDNAIPAMFAYHYGNQALQLLVHVSMVCLSFGYDATIPQDEDRAATCSPPEGRKERQRRINLLNPRNVFSFLKCMVFSKEVLFSYKYDSYTYVDSCFGFVNLMEELFMRYGLLRKLLQMEFVFETELMKKDFLHALQTLKEENIIHAAGKKLMSSNASSDKFEFLSTLLLPFLQSYSIICQHLTQRENTLPNCKKFSLQCQAIIENTILKGTLSDYRCLSLDIINNCIAFLINEHALSKISKADEITLQLNHPNLLNVILDLEIYLPPIIDGYNQNIRLAVSSAKL